MTTVPSRPVAVIGGVDTHADIHVATACNHLGAVLGTDSFPTTPVGYRRLLAFLASFGPVEAVGVEGTGSYGSGLARHLAEAGVRVVEVNRPNRQVRRRHGKSDTVDAIAAARAVISGQATTPPKSHDGAVEALRALQIVHRSAIKSRTQALNQLHALIVTAPEPIRTQLRGLRRRDLLATCQAYRPGTSDDLIAVTKFALRQLATRILDLSAEITLITKRRRRLVTATAPELIRSSASDPTPPPHCCSPPATTQTGSAHPPRSPRSWAPAQSRPPRARPRGCASTAAVTVKATPPSGTSSSPAWPANTRPRPTSTDAPTKA